MGLFDVLSGVTGRGEGAGAPPDAPTGDGSEGERAVARDPGDFSPADFRERAEALAGRSDVPELDFTEQALPDLDSMATGTHPVDDEITYGSYLGETLVREYDGEWIREDGWRVAVALGDDETTVAVFDAARMGLEGGPVFAQVAERLHDQGDPYAEGTGEESPDDESSDIDADTDGDVPKTDADAGEGAPESDDGVELENDDDGPIDDGAADDETTNETPQADPTAIGSTAVDSIPTASSDVPDDDEDDVETVDEFDFDGEPSEDGTPADESDPAAAVEDDAESAPAAAGSAVADEPAPETADPGDLDTTATGQDASVDDEPDAPDRDPVADEGDGRAVDPIASTADDEDTLDESSVEPVVDDAEVEGVYEDEVEGVYEKEGEGAYEDEGNADRDSGGGASEPVAGDDETEGSTIVDARSSELGVGPGGPTEADFARDPFERPSSAAADREESVDDAAGNDADHASIDDELAVEDSGIEEGTDADRESSEPDVDRGTTSKDDGVAERVAGDTAVDGTDGAVDESRAGDTSVAESTVDDTGDPAVIDEHEPVGSEDGASEEAVHLAAASEPVPADESTSDESTTDAPIVGDSSPEAPSIDETDVEEGKGSKPSVDEEPSATAPDIQSGDDAAVDDDPDEPSTDEPDVASVMPPADEGAPSRSEYEPAAISLRNAWSDYDFDFTPGSLARLDTFLDDQWAGRFRPGSLDDSDVDPDAGGPLVEVGAYVGEVLIQHYDAQWDVGENGEPALAIPGRHGRTETFPVFDVARTSLTENARVAYAVDALATRLDLVTRASGAEESAFALGEDGPGTATSSADAITTILERAEAFVASWPGYDLNYRPASLVRLDNLAKGELDREAFRATTLGDRTDPDALRLADRAAGASAYFAAVLVRHLDAQWEIDDEVALTIEGPAGETRVVPFEGSVDCLRGEASFMRRYDRVHDAVVEESRSTG